MSIHAEGTYEIQSWEEAPYDENEPKLVRARVLETFAGDLAGEAATEYLMTCLSDGSARFTGQKRMTGRLGDREGTFVLHEHGEYVGGNTSQGSLVMVPGSGTAGLTGIHGKGCYVATHGSDPVEFAGRTWPPTAERTATYFLDYDFE